MPRPPNFREGLAFLRAQRAQSAPAPAPAPAVPSPAPRPTRGRFNLAAALLANPPNPTGYTRWTAPGGEPLMSPGQTGFAAPTLSQQLQEGYLGPDDGTGPPSSPGFGDAAGTPAGDTGQAPHKGGYVKGNKRLTGGLNKQERKAAVPALLQKGEYVVNAKATAKHRDTLERINRSGLQPRDRMSKQQRAMRDRSTKGSPPMHMGELCQGYRRLG